MRLLVRVGVPLLALLGIGAALGHYLTPPYNPGFVEFPRVTALHVVLGAVYLALAPFQFVRAVRSRWPGYHRWAGRVLVAIGAVVGATALFMGFVFPMSGNPERLVIGLFGGFYLVSLGNGLVAIRARRIAQHREWMIRAFAIGLSIATMRLIFIPALILAGNPTERQVAFFSTGSFAAAFLLHAAVAEVWIRQTRRSAAAGGGPARRPAADVPAPALGLAGAGERSAGR